MEFVEFVEFVELAGICGISSKSQFPFAKGFFGVGVRIECARRFYSSHTNKRNGRKLFLITCHMFELRCRLFRVFRSSRGICGNSTNSTNSAEIPQIPQTIAVFGECCGRVRRAGLWVVAANLFLPDLNFSIVASAVAPDTLWNLWNLWKAVYFVEFVEFVESARLCEMILRKHWAA